jgi:hypothetical protein
MTPHRRSVLAALGLALPFGLTGRARAAVGGPAPVLWLRPFEEAVRDAFGAVAPNGVAVSGEAFPCRRIEVGHPEEVAAGLQGCHNDRAFAGYPAGHLRIVCTGLTPGPVVNGVRLYVATVDVALTGGAAAGTSRPLDFATIPPAPVLAAGGPAPPCGRNGGSEKKSTATPVRPEASKAQPLFANTMDAGKAKV